MAGPPLTALIAAIHLKSHTRDFWTSTALAGPSFVRPAAVKSVDYAFTLSLSFYKIKRALLLRHASLFLLYIIIDGRADLNLYWMCPKTMCAFTFISLPSQDWCWFPNPSILFGSNFTSKPSTCSMWSFIDFGT